MPRESRIEYSGAIYHVINRSDRRENIFEDDPVMPLGSQTGSFQELHQLLPEPITELQANSPAIARL